jgi:hypothetical protein
MFLHMYVEVENFKITRLNYFWTLTHVRTEKQEGEIRSERLQIYQTGQFYV